MKKVMVILFTLFISTLPPAFSQEAAVGETAPDFTLPDTFGRSHSLSDYSGKTVVLEWINPDCPVVKKH